MKVYLSKLLLLALFVSVPTYVDAALVNGSFEEPIFGFSFNFTGAYSFNGWSEFSAGFGGNAGIVVGTGFGLAPFNGNQNFSFNGSNPAPRIAPLWGRQWL